jgi:hypothetical protein
MPNIGGSNNSRLAAGTALSLSPAIFKAKRILARERIFSLWIRTAITQPMIFFWRYSIR